MISAFFISNNFGVFSAGVQRGKSPHLFDA
jgi:hypothetical protein